MAELQLPHWQMGQSVEWPKVNPYTIVQPVGEAGNIHISESGRYHVYWHRELPDSQIILVHHGGPDGFDSLSAVKHQHERVILRYTGMMISVPLEQQNEIPQEEQRDGAPIVGGDFPTLASQLDQLRLPGEQQIIRDWVGVLQDVSQDLPTITTHGKLTQVREKLDNLLKEKSLVRSTNKYKRAASASLGRGIGGERGDLLSGINEAQLQLLRRAEQTITITLGTMRRYNELEKLQISWNGAVDKLLSTCGNMSRTLNPAYPADRRERALSAGLESSNSIFAILDTLKGEPYFSKAQELIQALSPVRRIWEARLDNPIAYGEMGQALAEPLKELAIWRGRIQEEYIGVNFGKYALS